MDVQLNVNKRIVGEENPYFQANNMNPRINIGKLKHCLYKFLESISLPNWFYEVSHPHPCCLDFFILILLKPFNFSVVISTEFLILLLVCGL